MGYLPVVLNEFMLGGIGGKLESLYDSFDDVHCSVTIWSSFILARRLARGDNFCENMFKRTRDNAHKIS